MRVYQNLIGKKFGRLTAISRNRINKVTFYTCECECGKRVVVRYENLYNKTTKSCGCLRTELLKKRTKPNNECNKRSIYNYYKRNAKDRNLEWKISFDFLRSLILKPCHYCGIEGFTATISRSGSKLKHNGIDRIDNEIGYTEENCVPCCRICNFAKRDLSLEEFKNWLRRLQNEFVVHGGPSF